jgi:O-antigen/teichoic acid export membrane protein
VTATGQQAGERAGGVLARLERSARVIALVKLANVALILIWGFAVTFVFVRVLPLAEFQAFLLLVAFGNFTVSAEFGLTSIIYARLRRHWLGQGPGQDEDADSGFRLEEMGVLFLFLSALTVGATALLLGAMALGWVGTAMPLLFLLFFLSACLNLPALLAKRALAAIDGNLLWELLDCARRVVTIGLLLAVLAGLDARLSVALQLAVSILVIGYAIALLHRRLGMAGRHWLAFRAGGGHVRRHYLGDIGASALFTLSEILAYNAPYFTIAMASGDARPMLVFDFLFKMMRALSMLARAVVEAALPRITRTYHAGEGARFRQIVLRALVAGALCALLASGALLLLGRPLFSELFDRKAAIGLGEIALICVSLAALSIICVSVYVQSALGRFRHLLERSIPFLAGSLVSVPLALLASGVRFDDAFLILYALTLAGTAMLHGWSLSRLARSVGA